MLGLRFWTDGQRIRTSTEIEGNAKGLGRREANDWLRQLQSDAAQGISTPRAGKITVTDLVTELWKQYDIDLRKTKPQDKGRWRLHLEPFFGSMKALDVTRGVVREYIALRLSQKDKRGRLPKNATINRELSVLREAYSLALKDERLRHAPSFKGLFLDESGNVRKGFLQDRQYEALAQATSNIGLWMRSIFEIYYTYGWRRSEPLTDMRVRLLDFDHRTIVIENSKNGEGRLVKMTQKVFELLKACCRDKGADAYVFTREDGKPVRDFRRSWRKVTEAAGVPGLLVHDLRRTGARNMRRLGIDRDVMMKIGGWKTDSVFRRYNIVDEHDLSEASLD